MVRKKMIISLFHFTLMACNLSAQNYNDQFDSYLEQELKNFEIPNLEVLVVNKDSILYSKSIGVNSGIQTPYYIGSVSKSLSALGVLKLIELKQLSFDEEVVKILPNLLFKGGAKPITIKNLLNHTSGISKISGLKKLPSLDESNISKFTINLKIQPGQIHEYSNLNYSILGLIIEKISGLPYNEYMMRYVLKDLSMDNTLINTRDIVQEYVIDQFQYFGPFVLSVEQVKYSKTSIPAGFICSSSNDLGNYLMMNLNNGVFKNKKIIDKQTLQKMHKPWDNSSVGYAMGWKRGRINEKYFLQHLGSTATSYSGIFIVPEQELGLVVLSNSNSLIYTEELIEGLLKILLNESPKSTTKKEFTFRWVLLIIALIMVIHFIYRLHNIVVKHIKVNPKKELLNLIILGAIALILMLDLFPRFAHIPFRSFLKLQPDISIVILICFLSLKVLSIIKIIKSTSKY